MIMIACSLVDDEISFEEHSEKHTVPSPARLSCRAYTTFNLNDPEIILNFIIIFLEIILK
jgi:hypothetical protein